jgi:ABC-type uncharacterized transport system substrate-binding protein
MSLHRPHRREFLLLLGGASAWPFVAIAQQPERVPRIGVLMNSAEDDPDGQARRNGFLQGLQEFGWNAGRNVQIDYRWPKNDAERRRYAAELMALTPNIIVASTSPSMAALQQASGDVPIVFAAVTDPVGQGLSRASRGRAATQLDLPFTNTT